MKTLVIISLIFASFGDIFAQDNSKRKIVYVLHSTQEYGPNADSSIDQLIELTKGNWTVFIEGASSTGNKIKVFTKISYPVDTVTFINEDPNSAKLTDTKFLKYNELAREKNLRKYYEWTINEVAQHPNFRYSDSPLGDEEYMEVKKKFIKQFSGLPGYQDEKIATGIDRQFEDEFIFQMENLPSKSYVAFNLNVNHKTLSWILKAKGYQVYDGYITSDPTTNSQVPYIYGLIEWFFSENLDDYQTGGTQ